MKKKGKKREKIIKEWKAEYQANHRGLSLAVMENGNGDINVLEGEKKATAIHWHIYTYICYLCSNRKTKRPPVLMPYT